MAMIGQWLFGKPERMKNVSLLNGQQQDLHSQLMQSLMGQGAGGAFGDVADYYRGLLGGDSESQRALEAPMMRQFNEEIIPDLAEQFAGMGSGNLGGSSFRNAAVNAGAGLSERIAAMRAGLAQQGASGLAGLAGQGLNPVMQPMLRPQTGGLFGNLSEGLGIGLGAGLSNPLASGAGLASQWLQSQFGKRPQAGSMM